jgi:transcriptional regulator with XRE-family HTH domain
VTKSVFTPKYARFRRMLVSARKDAGLTQQALADELGWAQTDVSKVERGVRRLDLIEFLAFARVIGIDVPDFIRRLDKP